LFIPLLIYSSYLLITTLRRDVYNLDIAVQDIKTIDLRLSDLTTTILNQTFTVDIQPVPEDYNCSQIQLGMTILGFSEQ